MNVNWCSISPSSSSQHTVVLFLSVLRPSRGRGYLFPCSPELFQHYPLFPKIKILFFYIPCSPNYICSPVPFIFRLVFPCSSEINDIIPLFPITPGRASVLRKTTQYFSDTIVPDKRGYTHIFFLFLHENICYGYSLEAHG